MMDATFPSMNTGGTSVTFTDSASSNRKVTVGSNQNNSALIPTASWTTSGDARSRGANKDKTYATSKWQTMVAVITVRPNGAAATNNKLGVIKVRFFDPDEGEAPSFTPNYWDAQYMVPVHEASNANTSPPNPLAKFDTISLSATTNQGNEMISRVDNLYIYQAAPMSSYVTKLNNSVTNYKNSLSQAVVPAMKVPTTGTTTPPPTSIYFDVPPATNAAGNAQTVISQGWYTEGSEEPLTTSNTYVIPQSMAGKLLKAVVVVRDDVTLEETTYNPYIGYVRNDFDYSAMKYSFKRNTTNLPGYQADATDIVFTTTLNMNEAYGTNYAAGTFALIVARYGADGMLKEMKTFPKTTGAFTNASAGSKALTGTVSLANSVPGDTFKAFVWRSNVNTITSSIDDFAYDLLLPMSANRNSFLNQNTFTIPE